MHKQQQQQNNNNNLIDSKGLYSQNANSANLLHACDVIGT